MADSDSVLSTTTGTDQQDDPLGELTDEQLVQLIEDTMYAIFFISGNFVNQFIYKF